MIPRTDVGWQTRCWQEALADSVTDPEELFRLLELDSDFLPAAKLAAANFGLRVPRDFIRLMRKGDLSDPLLQQVLPLKRELDEKPGSLLDPVGDNSAVVTQGVLHKYQGRVLIVSTGACAIHCRFCFRRNFSYSDSVADQAHWQQVVDYIESHPAVREVILSGGDPLMLSDDKLQQQIQSLSSIGHVRRLRLHTRVPVVLPQRITPALLELLADGRLQSVMVFHINHPNELTPGLANAVKRLQQHTVTLLNQTVLLRGINDSVELLSDLSEQLHTIGILPYYLHMLDRVQGAGHFEVTDEQPVKIYRQLLNRLPGYLVPRLVREIEGEAAKQPVGV